MAKTKTVYFCSNCGNESPKWLGKCPNCGEWNTYVEEKVQASVGKGSLLSHTASDSVPVKLAEITQEREERIQMPSGELNRVLGGGACYRFYNIDWWRAGNRQVHIGAAEYVAHTQPPGTLCFGRGKRSPVEDASRPSWS